MGPALGPNADRCHRRTSWHPRENLEGQADDYLQTRLEPAVERRPELSRHTPPRCADVDACGDDVVGNWDGRSSAGTEEFARTQTRTDPSNWCSSRCSAAHAVTR